MNALLCARRLVCLAILALPSLAQVAADRFFLSTKFAVTPPPASPAILLEYDSTGALVASHDLVPGLPPALGANGWSVNRPCEVTPWQTVLCTAGYDPAGGWFEVGANGQVGTYYLDAGGGNSDARGASGATVAPDGSIIGAHYSWIAGDSRLRSYTSTGTPLWSVAAEGALGASVVGDRVYVGTFNQPGAATQPITVWSLTGASLGSFGAYRHVFVTKALPGNRLLIGTRPTDPTTAWLIRDLTSGSETTLDTSAWSTDNNWADVDDSGAIWIRCGNTVVRFDPYTGAATGSVTLQGLPITEGLAVSGAPNALASPTSVRWSGPVGSGPPPTYAHAMANDATTGNVMMFGGWTATGSSDATWLWNGDSWTLAQPSQRPAARRDAAMVHDPVRNEIVLFGGDPGFGTPIGDTWTWSNNTWVQSQPASSPPARAAHAMAWDPISSRVLMFGGQLSPTGPFLDETWAWDGQTWLQLSPQNSPSQRTACMMALDPARGRVVLFGGWNGSSECGDTWEWDGSSWQLMHPGGPFAPASRHSAGWAYSGVAGGCILFGGFGTGATVLQETWCWNGVSWHPVASDSALTPRYGAALAAHPTLPQLVLFGGRTAFPGGVLLDDTCTLGRAATYSAFGSGCIGPFSTVPLLSAVSGHTPRIGETSMLRVSNLLPPVSVAMFVFGFSNTADAGPFGSYSLPLDLSVLGWLGCQQLVSISITQWVITTTGTADYGLMLPYAPTWVGIPFYVQAMGFYGQTGVATTRGLAGVIGY